MAELVRPRPKPKASRVVGSSAARRTAGIGGISDFCFRIEHNEPIVVHAPEPAKEENKIADEDSSSSSSQNQASLPPQLIEIALPAPVVEDNPLQPENEQIEQGQVAEAEGSPMEAPASEAQAVTVDELEPENLSEDMDDNWVHIYPTLSPKFVLFPLSFPRCEVGLYRMTENRILTAAWWRKTLSLETKQQDHSIRLLRSQSQKTISKRTRRSSLPSCKPFPYRYRQCFKTCRTTMHTSHRSNYLI